MPLASAVATGRVGQYNHSEMELASGIWLKADATFDYGLTVGSLDETAHGRWTVAGNRVRLVSEPAPVAPMLAAGAAHKDSLVALSVRIVTLQGRGVEGVDVLVAFESGEVVSDYTQREGWALARTETRRPGFVTLSMPSYGLASRRFKIPSDANALTFVLTPQRHRRRRFLEGGGDVRGGRAGDPPRRRHDAVRQARGLSAGSGTAYSSAALSLSKGCPSFGVWPKTGSAGLRQAQAIGRR